MRPNASLTMNHGDVSYGFIGIEAVGPNPETIENSDIHDNSYIGFYEEAYSDTFEIQDCHIYGNGYAGVSVYQPKWESTPVYKLFMMTGCSVYSNGIAESGADVDLVHGGGNGVYLDALASCSLGTAAQQGISGLFSDRATGAGSGSHTTSVTGSTILNYADDGLLATRSTVTVDSCEIDSSGSGLHAGSEAEALVSYTRFDSLNVIHVVNDDGASTVLDGGNAFYRPFNDSLLFVRNDDADSLDAENNWWQGAPACIQGYQPALPDSFFVGPVDYAPRLCTEPSLMPAAPDAWNNDASELVGTSLQVEVLPNPAASFATIRYRLPASDKTHDVQISIYDVAGRRLRHSRYEGQKPGTYEFHWHGEGGGGSRSSAGVYFVRVTAGGEAATGKVILTR